MNEQHKNYENCLKLTKEHIQSIEKRSFDVLTEGKVEGKAYDALYDINQKSHHIKRAFGFILSE